VTIRFHCPQCGKTLKVPGEMAGKQGLCPRCSLRLTIPLASSPRDSTGSSPSLPDARPKPAGRGLRPAHKMPSFEDLVDMTAMVDIVFFLLIFFMVTSMQGIFSSIAVSSPESQRVSARGTRSIADFENDTDFAVIRIDGDDTIWIEADEVPSEQELRTRLRELHQGTRAINKLLVVGHPEAHQEAVVMVLDAANHIGIEELRMAVNEDEP
jgi:biopolymer transport protein ExbD